MNNLFKKTYKFIQSLDADEIPNRKRFKSTSIAVEWERPDGVIAYARQLEVKVYRNKTGDDYNRLDEEDDEEDDDDEIFHGLIQEIMYGRSSLQDDDENH